MTLGDLFPDGDLLGHTGVHQRLHICVDSDEFHTAYIVSDHLVDCVVPAAADTDNLYIHTAFIRIIVKFKWHSLCPPRFIFVVIRLAQVSPAAFWSVL